MNPMFNGIFGKVAPGMCRLSLDGEIAVKTETGYKSYNVKNNRLTNCDNFVFHIGEEFFFVIPTKKVKVGDIILIAGKPKCVIEEEKNKIMVINYEDSTIDTILPEHHVFMGDIYYYGKIVSMFGEGALTGKIGGNKIIKYMMMKELLKGNCNRNANENDNMMGNILPLMLMSGKGMEELFGDLFHLEEENEEK